MISNECCHWGYISDLVSLCSIFYVKIMCDRDQQQREKDLLLFLHIPKMAMRFKRLFV